MRLEVARLHRGRVEARLHVHVFRRASVVIGDTDVGDLLRQFIGGARIPPC